MNEQKPAKKRRSSRRSRRGNRPSGQGADKSSGNPQKSGAIQIELSREDREKLAKRARNRGELYEILSLLFQEAPSQDLLALYRHSAFVAIVNQFFPDEIKAFWERFANSKTPLEHLQARLRFEYHNLFLLPTSQRVATHESAYFFDSTQPDNGRKRVEEIQRFYKRIGMTPMAKFKDNPDHLSQIFHFMSVLCDREAEQIEKSNGDQLLALCRVEEEFVQRHLVAWIPQFCERLLRSTRYLFFRNIAELLQLFISQEKEWTNNLNEQYGLKRKQGKKKAKPQASTSQKSSETPGNQQDQSEGQTQERKRRRRRRPRRRKKKSGTQGGNQ